MTDCARCKLANELINRMDRMQLILLGAPHTPEELQLHLERVKWLRIALHVHPILPDSGEDSTQ